MTNVEQNTQEPVAMESPGDFVAINPDLVELEAVFAANEAEDEVFVQENPEDAIVLN